MFFSTAAGRPPERSSEQALLLCPFLNRQTSMAGTPCHGQRTVGTALPVPAALQNRQPLCPVPPPLPRPHSWQSRASCFEKDTYAGSAGAVSLSKGMLNPCPPWGSLSLAGAGGVESSRTAACSLDQPKKGGRWGMKLAVLGQALSVSSQKVNPASSAR